jgi:hypothetical protein
MLELSEEELGYLRNLLRKEAIKMDYARYEDKPKSKWPRALRLNKRVWDKITAELYEIKESKVCLRKLDAVGKAHSRGRRGLF